MMIHNKLDKLFGQAGSVLGWLLLLVGLFINKTEIAILFFLSGSFMALSYSAIQIDLNNNRYKFYYSLFGLISLGKWKSLNGIDGIAGISPIINRSSYLSENKKHQIESDDCFVVLFKNNPKKKIPLKRCKDLIEAKLEAKKASQLLNLRIIH